MFFLTCFLSFLPACGKVFYHDDVLYRPPVCVVQQTSLPVLIQVSLLPDRHFKVPVRLGDISISYFFLVLLVAAPSVFELKTPLPQSRILKKIRNPVCEMNIPPGRLSWGGGSSGVLADRSCHQRSCQGSCPTDVVTPLVQTFPAQ